MPAVSSAGPQAPRFAHAREKPARWPYVAAALVAGVVVFAGSRLCLAWIRDLHVPVSGDEPHYLVAALAIGKFHTLHIDEAYRYAIGHDMFKRWNVHFGPQAIATGSVQAVYSHHAYFSYHELGLPILLAVPTAIGGLVGAELGLAAIIAALTAALAYLVGRVSEVRSPWRLAVVGLFLSPGYLLASTQVYPDLVSGLLMAIFLLLVASLEVNGRVSRVELVIMGLVVGYLPWLHDKNFLIAAILSATITLAFRRRRLPVRSLLYVGVPAVVLWAALLAYNYYVFANIEGPGDSATFDLATWTRILALLIDRRQGIVIQMPAVLVGIAGIWVVRRRVPITVVGTTFSTVALIVLNGTLTNSFGGFSFVGRLQWEIAPALLAFAGLYLLTLATVRPRVLIVVTGLLGVVYAVEWIELVGSRHHFYDFYNVYNVYNQGYWNRDLYSGWWGALDPFSPILGDIDRTWTSLWHGDRVLLSVAFVLLLSALVVQLLVRFTQRSPWRRAPTVGVLLGLVAVTGIATTVAAAPSLATEVYPASVLASQVGTVVGTSRVVKGPSAHGALVYGPDAPVVPGHYVATYYFRLRDPQSQLVDVILLATLTSPPVTLATTRLKPAQSLASASLRFTVQHRGYLQTRAFWAGAGSLEVTEVTLVRVRG